MIEIDVVKKVLVDCLGLKKGEKLLVLADDSKKDIGMVFYEAGKSMGAEAVSIVIPILDRPGQEPIKMVAEAMKHSEVAVCLTQHSITHTKAKKEATEQGARIATMPGITEDMFERGALTADYTEVEILTEKVCTVLDKGRKATIIKDDYILELNINGRLAVKSTGRYLLAGQSGNLPSGEAYIAPIEGLANGEVLVDGSIAGLGRLKSPLLLQIRDGYLMNAIGEEAERFMKLIGEDNSARNIAEFGIGTNPKAMLTGNILEDEKILGTVHVAFGSNFSFGGNVNAGLHIDAVILRPTVYIDDILILNNGILKLQKLILIL